MKRVLLLLLLLIACSSVAAARGHVQGIAVYSQAVTTAGSNSTNKFTRVLASATVTVYCPVGTTTICTIYSDAAGTAKGNSFTAGVDGSYSFYTDAQSVSIRFSNVSGVPIFTTPDIPVTAGDSVTTLACGGTNDTALLSTANTAGGTIVIPNGITCASNSQAISTALQIDKGGLLKSLTGQTVTLTGPHGGGLYQHFTNTLAGQGTISFTGNTSIPAYYAEWFPGSDAAVKLNSLITAMPSTGGHIDARALTSSSVSTTIAANKQGLDLEFGSGTWTSTANPKIAVTGNYVTIEGAGVYATQLFVNSATNDGIVATGPISGLHIKNLAVLCHSNSNTRTAGKGISLNTVGDYSIENIYIQDGWDSLYISGSSTGYINNVVINSSLAAQSINNGVTVANTSIGTILQNVTVSSQKTFNAGYYIGKETDTLTCIRCGVQGGSSAGAAFGFYIASDGGSYTPRWIRLVSPLIEPEHTAGIGVNVLQGQNIEIDNIYSVWGLDGIHTSSGMVQDFKVIGGIVGLARQHGILIDAGTDIVIQDVTTTENSQATDNTYDGIAVGANINYVRILGCRSGTGLLTTLAAAGNGNHQRYGASFAVGTGNHPTVANNDFNGNSTGGFLDGATGTDRIIGPNVGVITFASGTSAVANTTTSIVVTHGLDTHLTTLTAQNVTITRTNNPTNNVLLYVSAVSSTTITFTTSGDPGASGLSFVWTAQLK